MYMSTPIDTYKCFIGCRSSSGTSTWNWRTVNHASTATPTMSMGTANSGRCVSSEKPIISAAKPTNESAIDSTSIGCCLRGSTSNMNFAPMRIEMMPTANGTIYIDVRLT